MVIRAVLKTRTAWIGAGCLLLVCAFLAPGEWPAVANLLIPAGAWCVLKGIA